jgi:hypothetical protein
MQTPPATPPPPGQLATFLGWFSLGLGVPQLLAPGAVNRLIGVHDDGKSRFWQRMVGVRELAAAAGILTQRRPTGWLWARVAGDVDDLVLLGAAWSAKRDSSLRLALATSWVAAVTAADGYAASRFTSDPEVTKGEQKPARAAVTIGRSRDEVEGRWQLFREDVAWDGVVSFKDAPGDRGTEVHAEVSGGLRLVTKEWVLADLRRFKQIVETGEVVRSEGTPEGPSVAALINQRPAQPLSPAGAEGSRS